VICHKGNDSLGLGLYEELYIRPATGKGGRLFIQPPKYYTFLYFILKIDFTFTL